MESHALNTVDFFIGERFVADLTFFVILVPIFVLIISIIKGFYWLIEGDNLSEDWQMWVEQFPRWLKDHVDGVFRKVDQVSENDD